MNKVILHSRKCGVTRSGPFEEKTLASHALNVGSLCGHGCIYCSTPTMERQKSTLYESIGETSFSAFANGYAIVDPDTPSRIKESVRIISSQHTVMFCTTSDAWSPEAQVHDLGRKCLVELLEHSNCKVRILTKNAAVVKDFDLIEVHKDRIEISLSITAPRYNAHLVGMLEPNASSIAERWDAIRLAHARGITIYGMLCPCLPGLVEDEDDYTAMLREILRFNPTAIWTEPVNPRGQGLKRSQEELAAYGFPVESAKIGLIRNETNFDEYELNFLRMVGSASVALGCAHLMRILIYKPKNYYNINTQGIIWLGKDK